MGTIYSVVLVFAVLIFIIGFLRIFSIDSSLRQILEILKKQTQEKKP
jgi:hypothetical protein